MGIRTSEDDDIVSRHVGADMSFCGMFSLSLLMLVLVGKDGYHLRGRRHFLAKSSMAFQPSLPSIIRYSHL